MEYLRSQSAHYFDTIRSTPKDADIKRRIVKKKYSVSYENTKDYLK
jgi:hypothetical protein